jgi:murein DD-endopeptidase / murein LD-carboxypeptidase
MSQLEIPAHFMAVRYNGAAHPLARVVGFEQGANCQRFVYALLEHFGYHIAPMRSSELWADRKFTREARRMRPLDILMFNRDANPWGAHLALYLGNHQAIHLSKSVRLPARWSLSEFARHQRYEVLVGVKRPIIRAQYTNASIARGSSSSRSPTM